MTIPDTAFGERVRQRLRDETLIWFTTTSADGTPQPNPVWFLWDPDQDCVLIYSATEAKRLEHVDARPRVSLNFQADAHGGDVIVITGVAERAVDAPANKDNEAYLAKYAEGIKALGSDREKFARDYGAPLRIRFTRVRGF